MFKKKPVIFKFVTSNKEAYEFAKPDKSVKFFPEWWKDLAKGHKERIGRDMTHCAGFVDLYKSSITLPLWSCFIMRLGVIGDYSYDWHFGDKKSGALEHPLQQRGSFFDGDKYQHLKLDNPWIVECKEEISLAWVAPIYNNELEGITPLGGVTTPKYLNSLNINLMFEKKEKEIEYSMEHGLPIMQFIPLTDREFKVEHEFVSKEEFENRRSIVVPASYGGYYKALNHFKSHSKCPFGFGGKK